jgi:hypothetical protein
MQMRVVMVAVMMSGLVMRAMPIKAFILRVCLMITQKILIHGGCLLLVMQTEGA